ncbi:MAG: ATP-dependent DNA helicase, partial [Brevundimonas sp.]
MSPPAPTTAAPATRQVAASPPPLPPALATPPGAGAMADDAGARRIKRGEAEGLFTGPAVIVAHAGLTARRLGLAPPPRGPGLFDALELFAFVRPATFCAPSPTGLALAVGLAEPAGPEAQALALREAVGLLLDELAGPDYPAREAAFTLNETLARAGWPWADHVRAALSARPLRERRERSSGLDVWSRLPEWEDEAPRGEAGCSPVDSESA